MSTQAQAVSATTLSASREGKALQKLMKLRSPLSVAAGWLATERDQAAMLLQEQTLPTTRDEDWRFTDLTPLYGVDFRVAQPRELPLEAIEAFCLPDTLRLVFVNGAYAPQLSTGADLPAGLTLGNMAQLQETDQPYFNKQQGKAEVFTALNTTSFTDAAVIRVSQNQAIATPIQLLFVAVPEPEQPTVTYPRCLVVLETGSSATLIEEYIALGEGTYFTDTVTEITVAANARLHHSRIQRESDSAFHIGKLAVSQARDSHYTGTAISLGGQISRFNPEIALTGEQTETILNGLLLAAGQQLADTHSTIAFSQPHCTSRQLHKCIVSDRGRGVFNGRVSVPKAAQLTDAGQLSRNLLLSPKARVDTKPQLEIVADNVKCSHGATVSQLDEEEVFYLQSRGLDSQMSRNLLIDAFAGEIIADLPSVALQQTLNRAIAIKIS